MRLPYFYGYSPVWATERGHDMDWPSFLSGIAVTFGFGVVVALLFGRLAKENE